MREKCNSSALTMSFHTRGTSRITSGSNEQSTEVAEVTAKLFNGLRDHPEARQLVISILEGQPDQSVCPACARPLDPGHKPAATSIPSSANNLRKVKPKKL